MRVLGLGSRTWVNEAVIHRRLSGLYRARGEGEFTVVHGDAGDGDTRRGGADAMIRRWAEGPRASLLGVVEERHPADWAGPCGIACDHGPRRTRRGGGEYCPLAGMRRNEEMVVRGADVCLVFGVPCRKPGPCRDRYGRVLPVGHLTHGTHDCASLALAAGIELHVWRQSSSGAAC